MQGEAGDDVTATEALERVVRSLWATPESVRPGRRPTLTLDDIVRAAIAIADHGGVAAVTMRAVAESLGRSPMTLYSYVRTKEELLDVMYDRALGELPAAYPVERGNWRAAIRTAVNDHWQLFQRHSWMLRIPMARPGLGPNTFGSFEALAAVLHAAGLPPAQVNAAAGAIALAVRSSAVAVADVRSAASQSGLTDDQWWTAVSPVLDAASAHVDWERRYPTITHLAETQTFDQLDREPDDPTSYLEHDALATFRYGIARLLDGIEATLDRVETDAVVESTVHRRHR